MNMEALENEIRGSIILAAWVLTNGNVKAKIIWPDGTRGSALYWGIAKCPKAVVEAVAITQRTKEAQS
jgi:hypothetical protein